MFAAAVWIVSFAFVAAAAIVGWRRARASGLDRWLPGYLFTRGSRRLPDPATPIHVFLCIADHYEPWNGRGDLDRARTRVRHWVEDYPANLGSFRDSDGRPPQHTFFYPAEEYDDGLVDELQKLCRAGYGEIEVHLHHDDDTAENLAADLATYTASLSTRHQSLSSDEQSGRPGFVFVHGNWALDNSRADGRRCGVNNELDVLQSAGCYADMTFPSAPSTTQPPTINAIYRALDDPHKPRSHDYGIPLRAGVAAGDGLLMIQGPLVLDWTRKKFGFLPRLENGCLQASQPPSIRRLDNWLRASVRVQGRPDWYFVKLHTHGAVEENAEILLGAASIEFHCELARRAQSSRFHYHYVTAREMVNVALAAEAGVSEWSAALRDYKWKPPSVSPYRHEDHSALQENSVA